LLNSVIAMQLTMTVLNIWATMKKRKDSKMSRLKKILLRDPQATTKSKEDLFPKLFSKIDLKLTIAISNKDLRVRRLKLWLR
jgi:hypothetical protein